MTFSLISADELRSDPPPVEWVVKNLVARGALTLLAGEGGLGKSSLALALAAAVSAEFGPAYYAGFRVGGGSVAYVDAENSRNEIHRRAKAFDLYEYIYQFEGDLGSSQAALAEVCERVRGGMVVLDSFRSLFPSVEENDTKSVMPALKDIQLIARVYDVGILILHHTSKSGVYRGSTEFQNRPDLVCTLRRDAGQGRRYIDWNKARICLEPDRHYLRIASQNGAMHWEEAFGAKPSDEFDEWA